MSCYDHSAGAIYSLSQEEMEDFERKVQNESVKVRRQGDQISMDVTNILSALTPQHIVRLDKAIRRKVPNPQEFPQGLYFRLMEVILDFKSNLIYY